MNVPLCVLLKLLKYIKHDGMRTAYQLSTNLSAPLACTFSPTPGKLRACLLSMPTAKINTRECASAQIVTEIGRQAKSSGSLVEDVLPRAGRLTVFFHTKRSRCTCSSKYLHGSMLPLSESWKGQLVDAKMPETCTCSSICSM